MKANPSLSRRRFISSNITAALAASAFPSIIPASVLGKDGDAPSQRIAVASIGVGPRGQDVLRGFLGQKTCQVTALCDVKSDVLANVETIVDTKYGNKDCKTFRDFREVVARKDIDAVVIASNDHWHVLHALAAVRAGKDVYVEKPLGLSLDQDQMLRREVKSRGRVFQFGTQQRSDAKFWLACELVQNGHIGKLKHINVWSPASTAGGTKKRTEPPATIDYNFWLGPAPYREHTEDLTSNAHWWFVSDFALGFIAGWGIHPLDIALWGSRDLMSGTVELQGAGNFPTEGLHDTATSWDIDFKYSSGLTMKYTSTPTDTPANKHYADEWTQRYGKITSHGTAFEGTDGWVMVDRGNILVKEEKLLELRKTPDRFSTQLIRSTDHARNFLEAVKSRQPTISSIDTAVAADALCHISDTAIRTKRTLKYDTATERIVNDPEAQVRLQHRAIRAPWSLTFEPA